MPPPEKLPREIEGLAFRNALTLDTGIDFHHHADRLIAGIGKAMDVAPRSRGLQKVPELLASAAKKRPLRKFVTRSGRDSVSCCFVGIGRAVLCYAQAPTGEAGCNYEHIHNSAADC